MTRSVPVFVRTDAAVVCAFLALGCLLGAAYVGRARSLGVSPEPPAFDQRIFAAAAMQACGRGLRTPVVSRDRDGVVPPAERPLAEFLAQRREALDCAEIPGGIAVEPLDGLQRASLYLLGLASVTWQITGLQWAGIDRLIGLLFGCSLALAYLTCRVVMAWPLSAAITVFALLSPLHLGYLANLRDYSKAPFLLGTLLAVGVLVTRTRREAVIIAVAVAAGAAIGFGFGVRTDIALNLVPVLAAAAGFLPGRLADTWRLRGAAVLACVVSFAAVAAPMFGSGASGSNLWHWSLLGYAVDSDRALDIASAPYEPGYFYNDSYVATTVDAFWGREGHPARVSVGIPGYAEASRRYYLQLLATFPGDAMLRGGAAILRILELPYSGGTDIPRGVVPARAASLAGFVERRLMIFEGAGLLVFAGVVVALGTQSLRLGAFLAALVVFLGAYPAIQFQPRHVFHLAFVSWWLLGAAATFALALPATARGGAAPLIRSMAACALAAVIAVGLLSAARVYQQRTATSLLTSYSEAPIEPLTLSPSPAGPDAVRVATLDAAAAHDRGRSIASEMLVAEISAAGCHVDRSTLTFRYRAGDPAADFTRTVDVEVPGDGGVARIYHPVFESGAADVDREALRFGGVEMAPSELPCLKRVSRFANPDAYPLLLPAVLPPSWQRLPLHQSMRRWEGDPIRDAGAPVTYWSPLALRDEVRRPAPRPDSGAAFTAPPEFRAGIAHLTAGGAIDVDGIAAGAGSYLVAWPAMALADSSTLVAEGRLQRGGITLGFADAGGWTAHVDIDAPGPFRAVLRPPRPGHYQFIVANHLGGGALRNRATISRIVFLDSGA